MNGFEGIYRSGESHKRREEVRERLNAGMTEKQIATDLGIDLYAVDELVASIREETESAGGESS